MDGLVNDALPSGWAKTTLGAVAGGPRARVAADTKSSLPFVGLEHIAPGALRPHAFGRFADMRSAASPFSAGDVLYARMRPYLNKVWRADREGVASAEFLVFPNSGRVHPDFLALLLHHQSFVEFARHASSGDRPRVEWADIASYPIWLPPYDEQTRIIVSLNALFEEIETGEAALARAREGLTQFRASLLHAAYTGTLTEDWRSTNVASETGDDVIRASLDNAGRLGQGKLLGALLAELPDHLPQLPSSWRWARLWQLCHVTGGITVDAKRNGENLIDVPYLRVANVQRGHLDLGLIKTLKAPADQVTRLALRSNDILLNEGGDRDKVGRGWIWESQIEQCIHQNHVFRARPYLPELDGRFISHYLNELGRNYFFKNATQTVNLASISLRTVLGVPIPVPPLQEMTEILKRITEIENSAFTSFLSDNQGSQLRQSILHAAFTGRLVPQDPADEPAEALLARLRNALTPTRRPRQRRGTTQPDLIETQA